jgi:hypothetical protein
MRDLMREKALQYVYDCIGKNNYQNDLDDVTAQTTPPPTLGKMVLRLGDNKINVYRNDTSEIVDPGWVFNGKKTVVNTVHVGYFALAPVSIERYDLNRMDVVKVISTNPQNAELAVSHSSVMEELARQEDFTPSSIRKRRIEKKALSLPSIHLEKPDDDGDDTQYTFSQETHIDLHESI